MEDSLSFKWVASTPSVLKEAETRTRSDGTSRDVRSRDVRSRDVRSRDVGSRDVEPGKGAPGLGRRLKVSKLGSPGL